MNDPVKLSPETIKTAELHGGDITLLTELVEKFKVTELVDDPLLLAVEIKRAQELLNTWRRKLCPKANTRFMEVMGANPEQKIWNIGGIANVSEYVPAGTWTWPANVVAKARELQDAQDAAKADKTATFTKGKLGPGMFTFKVALLA